MTLPSTETRPDEWHWMWCETCRMSHPVIEDFDDQIGFEEQAREVHVYRLNCGHEVVTRARG